MSFLRAGWEAQRRGGSYKKTKRAEGQVLERRIRACRNRGNDFPEEGGIRHLSEESRGTGKVRGKKKHLLYASGRKRSPRGGGSGERIVDRSLRRNNSFWVFPMEVFKTLKGTAYRFSSPKRKENPCDGEKIKQ